MLSNLGPVCSTRCAGLGLSEEIHVCRVAEAASAAVPYTALADMKDKQKISVWPRSCFDPMVEGSTPLPAGGTELKPMAEPELEPEPASNARELARQRARERTAAASPDARAAARERAKARAAAAKMSASES